MTRSTQLLMEAVSATKRRAGAGARPEPASMKFRVSEDNAGSYRWTIVAANGEHLAQSSRFASYREAERAARVVRSGAGSARFEDPTGDTHAVNLVGRRKTATVRDDLDAERWLGRAGVPDAAALERWLGRASVPDAAALERWLGRASVPDAAAETEGQRPGRCR